MAITRTPIVDDDGSGTTGTVIDNAWKQEFYNQIDSVIALPTTKELYFNLTASFYNNWRPPNGEQFDTWALGTTTAGVGITGILAEPPGAVHYLVNLNNNAVTLFNLNAGSASANQLYCPGNTNFSLLAGYSARIYLSTQLGLWVVQAF